MKDARQKFGRGIHLRLFSLLRLVIGLVAFGVFFYFVDSIISVNLGVKLLLFLLFVSALSYLTRGLEGRFAFLNKRIDPQVSVWIVFAIIAIPLFIII